MAEVEETVKTEGITNVDKPEEKKNEEKKEEEVKLNPLVELNTEGNRAESIKTNIII